MANGGPEYLDGILAELKAGRKQWRRGDKVLGAFGYTRRRQTAIDLINAELAARNLYTDPVLTTGMPLDRAIRFHWRGKPPEEEATPEQDEEAGTTTETVRVAASDLISVDLVEDATVEIEAEPPPVTPDWTPEHALIVGNLECAERPPECIKPGASVKEALTVMDLRDYSQLVVATGPREVKGIVSYKSVARAFLLGTAATVNDCLDATVPRVDSDEPLLQVVARFADHDAVLVFASDRSLAGIVTPADIATEFGAMAAPFLLVGKIEEQLRWLVQRVLDPASALAAAGAPVPAGQAVSINGLTMGELQRILENVTNWEAVGIGYDRAAFCKELNAVREIRNNVMHFRDFADPDEVAVMKRFAAVVQKAYLAIVG